MELLAIVAALQLVANVKIPVKEIVTDALVIQDLTLLNMNLIKYY